MPRRSPSAGLLRLSALLVVLAFGFGYPSQARAEPPRVVASILPLQSLAAMVMEGVGEPGLLLQGAVSPHLANLKPSQMRALESAGLVIWVGEPLETFLSAAARSLPEDVRVVALADAGPEVKILPHRDDKAFEAGKGDGHGLAEEHDHAAGEMDGHLWLSPDNARVIVALVARELAALDAENAERYRSNAEAAIARIGELESEIAAAFEARPPRPYVVFHDAYQYFERAFGLAPLGAVALTPEQGPGAGHMVELRHKLEEMDVACVFVEPQFDPALAETLAEGTAAQVVPVDPLGVDLEPGPDAYEALLREIADAYLDCFSGGT